MKISAFFVSVLYSVAGSSTEEPGASTTDTPIPSTTVTAARAPFIRTSDSQRIYYRSWSPAANTTARGIVYIVHGMSEDSERYSRFAQELADKPNLQVFAHDQRGHGRTACRDGMCDLTELGVVHRGYATKDMDAISLMAQDVVQFISATNTGRLPVVLFAHGMGSVVARAVLKTGNRPVISLIKGMALSGVPTAPTRSEFHPMASLAYIVRTIGFGLWHLQTRFTSGRFDQQLKTKLSNPALPPNSFVSSDPEAVRLYSRGPFTGHLVDSGILVSIASNLMDMKENPAAYFTLLGNVKIPFLFVAGRHDPVCMFGATAEAEAARMDKLGHPVTEVYLSRSRHEFLNEVESIRKEGTAQAIAWIDRILE